MAIPAFFQLAGIIPGTAMLAFLAFLSFITVTYVVEALSLANAWEKLRSDPTTGMKPESRLRTGLRGRLGMKRQEAEPEKQDDEVFQIHEKKQFLQMVELLFPQSIKWMGSLLIIPYYIITLAIFLVVIALSCKRAFCDVNGVCVFGLDSFQIHWYSFTFFTLLLTCISFVRDVTRLSFLQIPMGVVRILALLTMISIAIFRLASGHTASMIPVWGSWRQLPALFGASIYAYVCHHSLPSVIVPIDDKRGLTKMLVCDYFLAFVLYSTLCITAALAFDDIAPFYAMNFVNLEGIPSWLSMALFLLPIAALMSSFPIVAVTLRETLNMVLKKYFTVLGRLTYDPTGASDDYVHVLLLTLCSLLMPVILAASVPDVTFLVSIITLPGLGIVLIFPVLLVYFGRNKLSGLGKNIEKSPFLSPFASSFWLVFVVVCAVIAFAVMTFNLVRQFMF